MRRVLVKENREVSLTIAKPASLGGVAAGKAVVNFSLTLRLPPAKLVTTTR